MTTSAPRFTPFRGSIAGLCVPLSNASLRPRGSPTVAVGTALSGGPPHRSQRAELPHWAPRSGLTSDRSGPNRRTRSSTLDAPVPALCPGRVVLAAFPSRCPLPSTISAATQRLVRRLRRYYEAVRLPTTVHLGRAALAFPKRPAPFPVGGQSWDLPVLAHEDSAHAQVLRPRGVRWRLAHNVAGDVAFRLS